MHYVFAICRFELWERLKGQCHETFCFWFFSWIIFPPAPEYPIRTVSNFFENSGRYSQVKVHHRYQRHRWQICHRCQGHRRQNYRRYQWHRWQICRRCQLYRWQLATGNNDTGGKFCHRCQWHRWQTMGTISGCRYLKVNLKAKMYIYVIFTIQRGPNKIIKFFLIEDFFHLPPVSTAPLVNLELRISPRIFETIRNGPYGILRGLGETDSWKKPEVENLVALSLFKVSDFLQFSFFFVEFKI